MLVRILLCVLLVVSCSGAQMETESAWTDERDYADRKIGTLLGKGRFAEALALADSVIEAGGRDPRVIGQKARALGGLGRFDESIVLFEEAIVADYESCDNHINFAVVLMNMEKFGRAITELRVAKRFCPVHNQSVIHRNLAVANIKLGKEPSALVEVNEGLSFDPDDPYLLGMKAMLIAEINPATAESLFVAARHEGGENAEFLFQYGLLLLRTGRAREAALVLHDAARLRPREREIELARFEALSKIGRDEEAERLLRVLIDAEPDDELRGRLGRFLLRRNRYGEALEIFEQIPQTPEVKDRMAMCYHGLGDLDRAYKLEREVLETRPDWTTAMMNMAVILAARGELERAEKLLERVLELEPGNLGASLNLERLREAMEGAKR